MNGNLVTTLLAGQSSSLDLGAILQNYWYAFVVVPVVLTFAFAARSRKRNKTYRW